MLILTCCVFAVLDSGGASVPHHLNKHILCDHWRALGRGLRFQNVFKVIDANLSRVWGKIDMTVK